MGGAAMKGAEGKLQGCPNMCGCRLFTYSSIQRWDAFDVITLVLAECLACGHKAVWDGEKNRWRTVAEVVRDA